MFKIKKLRNLLAINALIILTSVSYCQQLPNYSGDWILNLDKSKLQAFWTAGLTKGNFKIVHNEPSFSVWRCFSIKGKEKYMDYAIQTNGQEQKGKHRTIWTLTWKQDTLVLIVKKKSMLNKVKYYYTENMNNFVADEYFTDTKLTYHNHWVFDRNNKEK